MSDFGEIIALIGQVTQFLFNRSVDLIMTGFLAISFALPWRILLWKDWKNTNDESYWSYCMVSFGSTLADLIVIPLLLFSLVSPVRWQFVYIAFVEYRINQRERDQDVKEMKLRMRCLQIFCGSITDLVTLFFLPVLSVFSFTGRLYQSK
jgi:hypothetical protein